MRKQVKVAVAALAMGSAAVPAYAVGPGYIYFQPGGPGVTTKVPGNTVVLDNFDNIRSDDSNFSGVSGTNTGTNVNDRDKNPPAYESSGNFAYVIGRPADRPQASYSISFAPAQVFTFILGSLNSGSNGNVLTLTRQAAGGSTTTQTFVGGQIIGEGINDGVGSNGRVTFDAQGGSLGPVISALFTTGYTQGQFTGFEFDNIATAAPEVAIWLSMIVGFGVAGTALRRGRSRRPAVA